MKHFALVLLLFLLNGCVYFERPMEPDTCWLCWDQSEWTMEDIHVQVNRLVNDKYYEPRRPEMKLNGLCLETAEIKYEVGFEKGYRGEIVIIRLHKDIEYLRRATSPHHAVFVLDGTVYDNGFISETPFDLKYLDRYGTKIPDVWSYYRKGK